MDARARHLRHKPWYVTTFSKIVARWRPEVHNRQLLIHEIPKFADNYFNTIPKGIIDIICDYVSIFRKHFDIANKIRDDYSKFIEKYRVRNTAAIGIKCDHEPNVLDYTLLDECGCTGNIKIKLANNGDISVWTGNSLFSLNTGGLLSKKLYPLPCGLMVLQINLVELCQNYVTYNNLQRSTLPAKVLAKNAIKQTRLDDRDWALAKRVNLEGISELIIDTALPLQQCEELNKCVATFVFDPETNYKTQIDLHDILGKEIIDDFGNRTSCKDLTDCEYAFSQYSSACCDYNVCNCE